MMKIIKPLRSGQITIPVDVRERLGIDEETLLQLYLVDREIRLKPVKINQVSSGSLWLSELYSLFSKSRKKAEEYSSEEIESDLDKAIKAVRKK